MSTRGGRGYGGFGRGRGGGVAYRIHQGTRATTPTSTTHSSPTYINPANVGNNGELLERSEGFDRMLQYIMDGSEDFKRNQNKFKTGVADSAEETWDYRLNKDPGRTIRITDTAFQSRLEEYDGFDTCDHEIIKIPCPCPSKEIFILCAKCHRVFCSKKCHQYIKDQKYGSGSRAAVVEVDSSNRIINNNPSQKYGSGSRAAVVEVDSSNRITNNNPSQMKIQNGLKTEGINAVTWNPLNVNSAYKVVDKDEIVSPQGASSRTSGDKGNISSDVSSHSHGTEPEERCMNKSMGRSGRTPLQNSRNRIPSLLGNPPGPPLRPNLQKNFSRPYQPLPMSGTRPTFTHSPDLNNPHRHVANYNVAKPSYIAPGPNHHRSQEIVRIPRDPQFLQTSIPIQVLREDVGLRPPPPPCAPSRSITENFAQEFDGAPKGGNFDKPKAIHNYESLKNMETMPATNPTTQSSFSGGKKREHGYGREDRSGSGSAVNKVALSELDKLKRLENEKVKSQFPAILSGLNSPTKVSHSHSKDSPNSSEIKKSPSNFVDTNRTSRSFSSQSGKNNVEKTDKLSLHVSSVKDRGLIDDEADFMYGVPMQIGFSYGVSIFDFYGWTGNGFANIEAISNYIYENEKNIMPLKSPIVGQYCLAKYGSESVADGWYRAYIMQVNRSRVKVHFIDYGNEAHVEIHSIAQLPSKLSHYKPSVIRISIGDFRKKANDDVFKPVFENYIVDKTIRATILENNNDSPYKFPPSSYQAKLEIEYENVWINLAIILDRDGFGAKLHINQTLKTSYRADECQHFELRQETRGRICHVVHLNEFYVIFEKDLPVREKISNRLANDARQLEELPTSKWLDANFNCVALRQQQWARARIIEVTEDWTAKVLFIDYGDTSEISFESLKQIPLELLEIPQLAVLCSLSIFPSEGKWDMNDVDINILCELEKMTSPVVIVAYTKEIEPSTHIIEVFQENSRSGLTKSLLKMKGNICIQEYSEEVDLNFRKKTKNSNVRSISKPDEANLTSSATEASNTTGAISIKNNEAVNPQDACHPLSISNLTQPEDLISYCGSSTGFKITFVLGFNRVFIKSLASSDLEMHIQDEIIEAVDAGSEFVQPPPLNTLVVAPFFPNDGNYYRTLVKEVIDDKVKLYYIDVGDTKTIPWKTVKPGLVTWMKLPPLVYEVKLAGVDDVPQLLLHSDFCTVMDKIKAMTHFLESCWPENSSYTVVLRPKNAATPDSVSERILQMQVWEWEKLYLKGHNVDTDLISRSKLADYIPPKTDNIILHTLPTGCKFEAEVFSSSCEGDLSIIGINDEKYNHDFYVLQNQMIRYAQKVAPSKFFPKFDEIVLVFIPDLPQLRAIAPRGVGRWNRCFMDRKEECHNILKNLDNHEIYLLDSPEFNKYFTLRKMPFDFLQVPLGIVECTIKGKVEKELARNKKITFTVIRVQQSIHIITIDNFKV